MLASTADSTRRGPAPEGLAVRMLMLGGTAFLGRALVADALARGWDVTTLNRGTTPPAPGVVAVTADRTRQGAMDQLPDQDWDVVVDTWSGQPSVVWESAHALAARAGTCAYVSSRSVYTWPSPAGADEDAPVVDADPRATTSDDYPRAKRGAELAVLDAFGHRSLLARAGLILGPWSNIGRLQWWLERMATGGDVLAPGPADLPLQYVDARDLAAWLLTAATRTRGLPGSPMASAWSTAAGGVRSSTGTGGGLGSSMGAGSSTEAKSTAAEPTAAEPTAAEPTAAESTEEVRSSRAAGPGSSSTPGAPPGSTVAFDVVSPSGHATMASFLAACRDATGSDATLHWVDPEPILAAGIEPWTQLPVWAPPGELHDALHASDVSKAVAAGLVCRPVSETVADTWAWLQADGAPPLRPDRPRHGLDPDVERDLLVHQGRIPG